jgi:hypothetical protein
MRWLLIASEIFFVAKPAGETNKEIVGAFGISLGSDAGQLREKGFTEVPTGTLTPLRVLNGDDPGSFFDVVQVSASASSDKIVRILGLKRISGASSFQRCLEEYARLKSGVEQQAPGLLSVPSLEQQEPNQIVSVGLTTSLGTGSFGSLFPWGRWVSIRCEAQGEDTALTLSYTVSSSEWKLANEATRAP